jgi:cysteinyl-tRNA synthetase
VTFLLDLVRECNRYLEKDDKGISTIIITNVARYITSILRTFGLVPDSIEIGFPDTGSSSSEGGGREQTLTPLLDVLTKFRETIRLAAISGDTKAVLGAADTLRDNILPDLGVRMEDKGSGADVVTVWKLDDPEVLLQERKLKEEAKAEKERQKLETLRKQREKEERSKISPETMFISQTDLYSSFDSVTGLPTHDKAGELLSKAATKKLQKEQAKQAELYQKASVV